MSETVKHEIDEYIDQHPDLKRQRDLIASIKGVGHLTAAKLLVSTRASIAPAHEIQTQLEIQSAPLVRRRAR